LQTIRIFWIAALACTSLSTSAQVDVRQFAVGLVPHEDGGGLVPKYSFGPARDSNVPLETAMNEEVYRIPVEILDRPSGRQEFILVTVYRPEGPGPFPVVIFNHGSPGSSAVREQMGRYRRLPRLQAILERGFAAAVPMRRGFGDSGGRFAEGTGSCEQPDFLAAGREAAYDVLSAVNLVRQLPYVQRDRIILLGQSAGGYACITAASYRPPGVIAAMNMAGGRAGRGGRHNGESCRPDIMAETIATFATTISIPILWHYAENDQYFGPHHVTNWFRAYTEAGAPGKLVMRPPFGTDGHRMFASPEGLHLWTSALDEFLVEIGFWESAAPP